MEERPPVIAKGMIHDREASEYSKPWAHRARKGTVALVFATAIGTLSALALNPQPAHALFEGNGMYVKGVGAQSVGGFWLGAYTPPHNVETRYPVWCTHMWRANP